MVSALSTFYPSQGSYMMYNIFHGAAFMVIRFLSIAVKALLAHKYFPMAVSVKILKNWDT